MMKLKRFGGNPIIKPISQHPWESKATFNPGAVCSEDKIYIIYRAMSGNDVSVLGLAISSDGFQIDERLEEPIYVPRESFEIKGCEDPRIVKIGNKFYMCYTAYDGITPRVALTSIKVSDFLKRNWNWEKPLLISPLEFPDKNACILPEKIGGKYFVFHRLEPSIWVDSIDDPDTLGKSCKVKGTEWLKPRTNMWDSKKIGIAPPFIKTESGWVLIYHAVSEQDQKYRLGKVLLDLKNPTQVITRSDYPILEPEEWYENEGLRPGTVFACGAVVIKDKLFVYYGAADKYVCVATANLDEFLEELKIRPSS